MIEKKITLGRSKDGKLIRKSIYGKTKAEVEKKVFAARQKWLEQNNGTDESVTFMTYVRRWYKLEKAQKSFYTKQKYDNIIKNYLSPNFEDLYFHELTLGDFQQLINDNSQYPTICGIIKNTLTQVYASAENDGLIKGKYPNFRRLVVPERHIKEKRALTEQEKQAIFSADLTDMEKAFVYILFFTGMRREEALALEPSCFDFQNNMVEVKQTVVFATGGSVLKHSAKNFSSLRTINLPDACVPFLKEYCKSCKKWLFPSAKDEMKLIPGGGSFTWFWDKIKLKLSEKAPEAMTLTAHIFRHNYATMLYYSNISIKKAAQLLGHSDTKQIMKTYAHLDEAKEQTQDKLNAVFSTEIVRH